MYTKLTDSIIFIGLLHLPGGKHHRNDNKDIRNHYICIKGLKQVKNC